ncbi:hypothetical protein BpHYR1_023798 [Brachionus plicatilis]|uniref:Uncharacterized protein n=1 Tax=Brachionus plicatilis TaxID=10195 RepID=A0A3M7QIC1_BRAPC|nr:hypothetical protein BpHYR1_023798 [Brachionus plicatilis]
MDYWKFFFKKWVRRPVLEIFKLGLKINLIIDLGLNILNFGTRMDKKIILLNTYLKLQHQAISNKISLKVIHFQPTTLCPSNLMRESDLQTVDLQRGYF